LPSIATRRFADRRVERLGGMAFVGTCVRRGILGVQGRLAAIIGLAMGKPVEQDRTFQMERVKGFRSMILSH